jgi:hypothetical protein
MVLFIISHFSLVLSVGYHMPYMLNMKNFEVPKAAQQVCL